MQHDKQVRTSYQILHASGTCTNKTAGGPSTEHLMSCPIGCHVISAPQLYHVLQTQKSSVLSLCWPSAVPDARPYLTQAAGQWAAFLWSRAALPAEVDSSDPRGVCPHVWSHLWRHCWCALSLCWAEQHQACCRITGLSCAWLPVDVQVGVQPNCDMLHYGTASCCCRQEPMQVAISRQHYALPHLTLYHIVGSGM